MRSHASDPRGRTRVLRASLLLTLLLAAGSASADSITIVGGGHFSNYSGPRDGSTSTGMVTAEGTFDPFDTSLGILTAVSFKIGGSFDASLLLSDLEPGLHSGTLYSFDTFAVRDGANLWTQSRTPVGRANDGIVGEDGLVTAPTSGLPSLLGTGTPFEMHFSDGNGGNPRPIIITDNLDVFLTPGTVFVGARHYLFDIRFPDGSTVLIPASRSGALHFGVDSTITYTYTPVPEPSTALLVGMGLGWMARRRRVAGRG